MIRARFEEQERHGAAFCISSCGETKAYLATAEHVVRNIEAGAIQVLISPNEQWAGISRIVFKDLAADIAVLEISGPLPRPRLSRGAEGYLRPGDPVGFKGYIHGKPWTGSKGLRVSLPQQDRILLYGGVLSGQSGGPLWDRYGNTIGLNSKTDEAVTISRIQEIIAKKTKETNENIQISGSERYMGGPFLSGRQ